MVISFLLKLSRPRFWMYTIGPYLIGIGAASTFDLAIVANPDIWWWLFYFSFPANLFIYGINDYADGDTDAFNAKKGTYEVKITPQQRRVIIPSIVITTLPFIPLMFSVGIVEKICFLMFVVFGIIYSLPPVRLKIRPYIDSLSNGVLYTMAGLMGFYAAGGVDIQWLPYLAGALWAATMHAYSAIPDIAADTRAGIRTIATSLGARRTLYLCGAAYSAMAGMLVISGHEYHALLAVPYIVLIAISLRLDKKNANVFTVYKAYPYVTYIVGASVYALSVNF